MAQISNDLTNGKSSKVLIAFTIPLLLGNLFQQIYNIVDSVVVGRFVGDEALAAVGASFPIVFLLIAVAIGLTMGCSVVISQLYGAGKLDEMRRAISTTLIFMFAISLALTAVGVLTCDPLLRLLKTPDNIIEQSSIYLNIFFLGLIFLFVYNTLSSLFRSLGDSKTPLFFLIISSLLNVVLDLFFVIVLGMGVAGVAVATVISQGVSVLLCIIYIKRYVPQLSFKVGEFVFDVDLLKEMIRLGIPSTIQQLVVSLGMMALQGLINTYGSDVIAGYTAATKIDSIAMMPIMNLSIALSTFTAQNIGANKIERVKEGYKTTVIMSASFAIFISLMIFVFGKYMINIFNDKPEVVSFGVQYLIVVSAFYVLMGLLFSANGVLRGSGDMTAFTASTIVSFFVRVGSAYFLSGIIGYSAIWWSIPIGWTVGSIIATSRYLSGVWKTKSVIARRNKMIDENIG